MGFELQSVVWTSLILLALIMIQGTLVPLNQGFGWGLGSRDAKRETTVLQARTSRTVANHIEGMLIFVPLVIVSEIAGLNSMLTQIGAGLYLAGRVLFAPLYLMGVAYLRSAAWGVSLLGIGLVGYVVLRAALFS